MLIHRIKYMREKKRRKVQLPACMHTHIAIKILSMFNYGFMQYPCLSLWSQHENRTSMLFWQLEYVLDIQLARCWCTLDVLIRIALLKDSGEHISDLYSLHLIVTDRYRHACTQLKVDNCVLNNGYRKRKEFVF
jgi:hypothetical protein